MTITKEGKSSNILQLGAGVVLGLLIPIFLLLNVIINVSNLEDDIGHKGGLEKVVEHFIQIQPKLESANDYAFISMLAAENANQKTMINKQVMKVAVIQVGFAVISIGLLFVVLGFNDGGMDTTGSSGDLSFNVKTGSTGLAAIIIGAAMATFGGILKNEYNTVQVPKYYGVAPEATMQVAFKKCKSTFAKLPIENQLEAVGSCMSAAAQAQLTQ